jgi:hypothetical protein
MCKTADLVRARRTLLFSPEEKAARRRWNMPLVVCADFIINRYSESLKRQDLHMYMNVGAMKTQNGIYGIRGKY